MSISLLLLEFPGTAITGDCSITGFQGHISLESFSWGAKAVTKQEKGKKPTTSVKFEKLQVTKIYDCASIPMYNMMNSETKFAKAVLKFIDPLSGSVKAGARFSKFESIMEMEMTDGYIESVRVRASESAKAISVTEDVELSFHEVSVSYYAYDPVKNTRVSMPPFQTVQPEMT
jgi:type VI protein secretion system component Hcp